MLDRSAPAFGRLRRPRSAKALRLHEVSAGAAGTMSGDFVDRPPERGGAPQDAGGTGANALRPGRVAHSGKAQ
jgi:hypothetical protein